MSRAEPGSECSVLARFHLPREERADRRPSCYGAKSCPKLLWPRVQGRDPPPGWHQDPLSGLGVPMGDIHRHWIKPQGIACPTSPRAMPQNWGQTGQGAQQVYLAGVSGSARAGPPPRHHHEAVPVAFEEKEQSPTGFTQLPINLDRHHPP